MMDVPRLIGQDFSNPLVAPHIVQYPEVTSTVSEAWQAAKWLEQVPLDHLTPMYAAHGKHFYVNELSCLHDGALVIPYRWVKLDGKVIADCRRVITVNAGAESNTGTLSVIDEPFSVPVDVFLSNYLDLVDHMTEAQHRFTAECRHYGEQMPNPLRSLADGDEMVTCFIEPWSNDVSGGRTKQYQPHNNIYLMHTNIPGKLLNQEFFIQFVSTATHASSTEQFAALRQQLE
ncbi:hypothetical protein FRC09_002667 [Ceratobasidium sp. 395]|nr:hypothetical protein FRC09_002667 [Ceratobasidium sp. 395]